MARAFVALGAGEAISRLIAFGATVYAARVLGPAAYGVLGVATAITLYLNRVADLGFDLGLGVREVAADPGFLPTTGPTVLGTRTLVAVLLAAVTGAVALFALPAPDGPVLAVQALTLLAVGASTRWVHVASNRAPLVGAAQAIGQAVMVGLVVAFVRSSGDILRVPGAQVIGDLTASLILLGALVRAGVRAPFALHWSRIRPLLPRSAHLVASALLGIIIYNADFIFLRVLKGSSAVGLYAAAYTLVTFFLNVGAAYNLSLLPSLTRLRLDRPGQQTLYHAAMAHVFAIGLPLALGGTLVAAGLVRLVYGPDFQPAAVPFALLVWCIPLNLLRDVPLMAVLAEGGERAVFAVTVKAALINLGLNVVLIPRFGLVGAASATLVTETIRMALAVLEARRRSFAPPAVGRFVRALGAGGLMAAAVLAVGSRSIWLAVPVGVAAYGIGLMAAGGLRWRGALRLELTV